MLGNATVGAFAGGAGAFDLKEVAGTGVLTLGRTDLPFSIVGLYGSLSPTVSINNPFGRFEIRDGATVPAGFAFTDRALNPRALQSDQNTTPAGINAGTDHTLSIWKGQTGVAGTNLTSATFLMSVANNAAGLYVDDAATGAPIVNDIQSSITLGAPGTVLFSARSNTDAAVNGIARIRDVTVDAAHALLATRDLADLEVGNLTIARPTVLKVAGARTDGRGAVRIGTVAAAANAVHFQDGRTTISGNVTSGKITAGGTSLEINPGAAGTAVISASAVQVNVMLAAKSGTVNFGNTVLTGAPVGSKIGGLVEGVITGSAGDYTTVNPGTDPNTANLYDTRNTGIRLDPRAGMNNATDDNATITNDTARGWSRNQTWVYTGEIYDADGVFTLAENIDDNTQIKIDGVIVQNSNGTLIGGTGLNVQAPFSVFQTVTNTASRDGLSGAFLQPITGAGDIGSGLANTTAVNLNPAGGITNFGMGSNGDGWHTIEIRIGNGTGGAGPVVANGWGNYFGIGLNKDGGASFLGTDYSKPIDDGGMSLFRAATVAKGNVDVDNGATVTAGNLSTIGLLTLGRNGASGAASITLAASTAGDVDRVEVPSTAVDPAVLSLASSTGKLTAAQVNVADAKSLSLNPSGLGELEVTAASSSIANNTASVLLNGGKLRLSNASGSALADASLTLAAGTLMGNGATTGTVLANAGSIIAPGSAVGQLSLGDTTLQDNSSLEWEVSDWTGAAGVGYDTLAAAALHFTAGAGTVPLRIKQSALTNFSNTTKSFTLASVAGAITDFSPAKIVIDSTGFSAGSGTWAVSQVGSDLILTYTGGAATVYDTWAASFGLGAQSGITADPDMDGKTNLLEFALNSNPTTGLGSGQDKTSGTVATLSGSPAAVFTLPVRTGAVFSGATELSAARDGVRYRIQASTDLLDWTLNVDEVTPALSAGQPVLDSGWEYRTFRVPGPVSSEVKVFFRAVIEPAP